MSVIVYSALSCECGQNVYLSASYELSWRCTKGLAAIMMSLVWLTSFTICHMRNDKALIKELAIRLTVIAAIGDPSVSCKWCSS